jgi:hypothetical protein
VWAYWIGRASAIDEPLCRALARARDEGVAAIDAIAAAYADAHAGGSPEVAEFVADYLRRNISYELREAHEAALERFYASAATLGIVPCFRPPRLFGRDRADVAR